LSKISQFIEQFMNSEIRRNILSTFIARLLEPRRFLQVVAGPRQVGKTTLVGQALDALSKGSGKLKAARGIWL
jgi:predicted AAA+ superfamily ATPase